MDGKLPLPHLPTEAHRRIFDCIVDEFVADPQVCGVLLCGSCARGNALPGSDLDLRVFVRDGGDRPESAFQAGTSPEGVYAEVTTRTIAGARQRLETHPMEVYPYREGLIFYDRDSSVAELRRRAAQIFDEYRAPDDAKSSMGGWLASTLRKVEAAREVGDEARAAFVVTTSAWAILEGLFLAADLPQPPSGAVLAHLELACGRVGLSVKTIAAIWGGEAAKERVESARRVLQTLLPVLQAPVPS